MECPACVSFSQGQRRRATHTRLCTTPPHKPTRRSSTNTISTGSSLCSSSLARQTKLLVSSFSTDLLSLPLYHLNRHTPYHLSFPPTLPDSVNHMAALAFKHNLLTESTQVCFFLPFHLGTSRLPLVHSCHAGGQRHSKSFPFSDGFTDRIPTLSRNWRRCCLVRASKQLRFLEYHE